MEKLLAIISLGQTVYGRWRLQRLVGGIMVIAVLTLVTAILVGTMLISGFYAGYLLLLHYGVEPYLSALIIYASIGVTALALILLLYTFLRRLRSIQQRVIERTPLVARANDMVDAFLDGLLAK